MKFVFLSYKLDPADSAWPGEAVLHVEPDAQIGQQGKPFNSVISHLPNHFGTHFDAPRHFCPDGIAMHQLPIDYFAYTREEILLVDIPKAPKEIVMLEDILPYAEPLKNKKLLLIRTGFEAYRRHHTECYINEGPSLHPDFCRYLVENFAHLHCIGMDFLSIGSPCNDLAVEAHRWLLGYYSEKFITAIEDMPLSPLGDEEIQLITLGPSRIVGADSAQVSVIAQIGHQAILDNKG